MVSNFAELGKVESTIYQEKKDGVPEDTGFDGALVAVDGGAVAVAVDVRAAVEDGLTSSVEVVVDTGNVIPVVHCGDVNR